MKDLLLAISPLLGLTLFVVAVIIGYGIFFGTYSKIVDRPNEERQEGATPQGSRLHYIDFILLFCYNVRNY